MKLLKALGKTLFLLAVGLSLGFIFAALGELTDHISSYIIIFGLFCKIAYDEYKSLGR